MWNKVSVTGGKPRAAHASSHRHMKWKQWRGGMLILCCEVLQIYPTHLHWSDFVKHTIFFWMCEDGVGIFLCVWHFECQYEQVWGSCVEVEWHQLKDVKQLEQGRRSPRRNMILSKSKEYLTRNITNISLSTATVCWWHWAFPGFISSLSLYPFVNYHLCIPDFLVSLPMMTMSAL